MARLRDEAEALAVALEFGLCDVPDAVAWADAWILREDVPPGWLCDVALAGGLAPRAVKDLLHDFPGEPDRGAVDRLVLAVFADRLREVPASGVAVVRTLYRLTLKGRLADPDLEDAARWADDELDLLEQGYAQTSVDDVVAFLQSSLEAAVDAPPAHWSIDTRTWRGALMREIEGSP